ncbi:hypothetical protein EI94DRAFT_192271 [Lactarius quietus]|nr:hypothetical protein EI94DRAFT_192271 [Lactarius quietus]
MTTAISPSNSRGMGWRKPVPVFIPTPPVSRPTSDSIFSTTLVSAAGDDSTAAGGPPPSVSRLPCYPSCAMARRLLFFFSQRCLITGAMSSETSLEMFDATAAASNMA